MHRLWIDVPPKADHSRSVGTVAWGDGVHQSTVGSGEDVRDVGSADVDGLLTYVIECVEVGHFMALDVCGRDLEMRRPYGMVYHTHGMKRAQENRNGWWRTHGRA